MRDRRYAIHPMGHCRRLALHLGALKLLEGHALAQDVVVGSLCDVGLVDGTVLILFGHHLAAVQVDRL